LSQKLREARLAALEGLADLVPDALTILGLSVRQQLKPIRGGTATQDARWLIAVIAEVTDVATNTPQVPKPSDVADLAARREALKRAVQLARAESSEG
jgi:hypothetical protein